MRVERRLVIFVISLIVLAALVAISMQRSGGEPRPTSQPTAATPRPASGTAEPPIASAILTPSPNPGADVSGTWTGTWSSPTAGGMEGTLIVTWTQTGADLEGSITLDGTSCLDSGVVRGTVDVLHIAFSVGQRAITIDYEGAIEGNSMSGTFLTRCDIDSGTWTMQKTG